MKDLKKKAHKMEGAKHFKGHKTNYKIAKASEKSGIRKEPKLSLSRRVKKVKEPTIYGEHKPIDYIAKKVKELRGKY